MKTFFLGVLAAIISTSGAPSVQAKSYGKPSAQTERFLPLTDADHFRTYRALPVLPARKERKLLDLLFARG